MRLLIAYRDAADRGMDGLNDEEAAELAELGVRSCWWKRCGELRDDHLIERPADLHTRAGSSGVERIVCMITDAGRAYLKAMEL